MKRSLRKAEEGTLVSTSSQRLDKFLMGYKVTEDLFLSFLCCKKGRRVHTSFTLWLVTWFTDPLAHPLKYLLTSPKDGMKYCPSCTTPLEMSHTATSNVPQNHCRHHSKALQTQKLINLISKPLPPSIITLTSLLLKGCSHLFLSGKQTK